MSKLVLLSACMALASCAEDDTVNRVQVNVVEKTVFEGSWYMSRTVIDVDYEGAGLGTFPGDAASDFGENSFSAIPRVRWVIDEDYLYAYRDYELISGVDGAPREPGSDFGQPVAAYRVESHFDIERAYNPITGEQQNVIVEDTQDRNWYERQFMRVDWSVNALPGYYGQIHDLYAVLGLWSRESSPLYIQAESEWPDSWQPTFTRMSCSSVDDASANCDSRDRDWAGDYEPNELYHISFVQQDLMSPGLVPDPFTGQPVNWCMSVYGDAPLCSAHAVYTRTSFLKVSDTREYVPTNWVDSRFDRHGYFRLEQPTYDRSVDINDPAYFETDFLNYSINRHNIWRDWVDDSGNPIPYADRPVRQIVWYTTPELPAHLVKPSMSIASAWNEPVMATIRALRGRPAASYPRMNCQTTEPDAYCFCQTDPADGSIINPTCAGQYDPFLTPEQHIAAGATEPYDCWVDVPAGAEPADMNKPDLSDADFYGWYGASFQGTECANILRINACNRAAVEANDGTMEGMPCEERGDMRFKFMSYVDQPGTSFLGIATLRGDPVTGEILVGDANIGGPALDGYRTFALQEYDLVNGNITEQEVITGEDVRDYLQSLNQVDLPAPPRVDFNVANLTAAQRSELTQINGRMDRVMERAEELRGPEGRHNIFSDRVAALAGSDIEARLTDNMETYALAGLNWLPSDMAGAPVPEGVLEAASPFRTRADERLAMVEQDEIKIGSRNVHMPNEYIDNSVIHFVRAHADWPRARLEIELNRHLYFETELHEMGHCMGMRHQFTGSADNHQYFDDYYLVNDRFPLPDPADFDRDTTPGLSVDEQVMFENAYNTARQNREQAGIDRWMNTSTMEYTANWYERVVAQTGHYDLATIMMGYGDVVEIYDNAAGIPAADINPANTTRIYAKWYMGGESCSTDAECPFSAGGARAGELLEGNTLAGVTQRCVVRTDGVPGSVCSNFDEDSNAVTAATPNPRYAAVNYLFCTDERATGLSTSVGTHGVCNRYDEGDSYREIVRNVAESYERMYLWTNFRRYREGFNVGTYLYDRLIGRRFIILQNVYQNLVYRYATDPEFRTQAGAYGFYDQFMATADILNLYARVLGQPDVGQYQWNADWERYERVSPDPRVPMAQLSVPIGMGRYFGSVYQRGTTGIYRVERVGTFFDKWFVLDLMTSRGLGYHRFSSANYGQDVPFYTNMYDLFPLEMQQIFSGMIRDEPSEYMPRIQCQGAFPRCTSPRLVYLDFYRGDCSPGSTTCRPDPIDVTYRDDLVMNGGGNIILQIYAALYGLAEFPTFFDTTFANQLFICREGNGDCPEPGAAATDGTDFVRYTSERYGQSFLAYQVEPSTAAVNQTSIGFELVKEARDLSFILQMLRTYRGDFEPGSPPPSLSFLTAAQRAQLAALEYELPPADAGAITNEINRVYGRVLDLESFFNQLIQLERQMGVGSYLGFRG